MGLRRFGEETTMEDEETARPEQTFRRKESQTLLADEYAISVRRALALLSSRPVIRRTPCTPIRQTLQHTQRQTPTFIFQSPPAANALEDTLTSLT